MTTDPKSITPVVQLIAHAVMASDNPSEMLAGFERIVRRTLLRELRKRYPRRSTLAHLPTDSLIILYRGGVA